MNLWGMIWLGIATVIFLLAATVAKHWAVAPHVGKVVLALALYSAGNLIMLKLVRDFGMASAFSLSAIIQLVAVNLIALIYFGERLGMVQGAGVLLAVVAVAMIMLGPAASGR
jgi:glucose uptake protein GlcU